VNSTVHPFDFTQIAEMYVETTMDIQTRAASGTFNLGPALDRVRKLKAKAETLNEALRGLGEKKAPAVNDLLVEISRILTSTFYTDAGPFDQDPAYGIPHLPALQDAAKLAGLDPGSDEAGFLRTRMVRETNRVCKALDTATKLIEEATDLAG
jgi:hypothetical protein